MEKVDLSWNEVFFRSRQICEAIIQTQPNVNPVIYGIPRGGIYPALIVAGMLEKSCKISETPEGSNVFVDDIIDSGRTAALYRQIYPTVPFYPLVDKLAGDADWGGLWVSFPWERMGREDSPSENVVRLLQYIGEDPNREGLKDTPNRVIKSYDTLFSGYKKNPKDVLKVFEDGSCDEMVLLKNCEFSSTCEHHMLPFIGKAHIAYIPNGRVIGISKLARILEIFARRLQIQERIGQQITSCLDELMKPKGSACILEAQHMCMTCRGVEKQHSVMVTSSLTGVFRDDARTRSEFLSMVKG